MKWASCATCLALVAALCVACGSFGSSSGGDAGSADAAGDSADDSSDAAPACVAETCAGGEPSCSYFDFQGGCPPGLSFAGDVSGVVGECAGGKLHVAGDNTKDITAELNAKTPGAYTSIHVSARIAVMEWDGKRALVVELEGVVVAELDVVIGAAGRPIFHLCNEGNCLGTGFEAQTGEEHLFVLDITSTSVSLSVDCQPVSTVSRPIVLAPMTSLLVKFGKTDAAPIDGTIDDLAISYR